MRGNCALKSQGNCKDYDEGDDEGDDEGLLASLQPLCAHSIAGSSPIQTRREAARPCQFKAKTEHDCTQGRLVMTTAVATELFK